MNDRLSDIANAPALEVTALSPDLGQIVHSVRGLGLRQVSSERVIHLFKQAGVLLFRGFGSTLEEFSDFTAKFTSQFVIHRNSLRHQIGANPTIQTVFVDPGSLPFHGEMHYVPARHNPNGRPDILWFYCIHPGRALGETILCDGITVWQSLSADARNYFERRKLRYRHRTPSVVWKSVSSDPAVFLSNLACVPGVTNCQVDSRGDLQWDFVTPAAQRTKYTDKVAFVNSLLPPSDAYEVSFDDGSTVPQELRQHILEVTERLTVAIQWQACDIAMVDNTRCMHGRYSNDEDRKIIVKMSISNF